MEASTMDCRLWLSWLKVVLMLREGFARERTFHWAALAIAGFCMRQDRLGVTDLVRETGLIPSLYQRLLDFFHSSAVDVERLARLWLRVVIQHFNPLIVDGYMIFLADGIKVGKEGRKMPGVKLTHQSSSNNSKAEYIMAHCLQQVSILITNSAGAIASLPLITQIHEGVKWNNRDSRTLLDKLAAMMSSLTYDVEHGAKILVADAYYAAAGFAALLWEDNIFLLSRLQHNAVAYYPAEPSKVRKRGRPRIKGDKVKLWTLFQKQEVFVSVKSPIAGETCEIRYLMIDLIRTGFGLARFVLVDHPERGRMILITNNRDLDPVTAILLYSHRFRIEFSFKQAVYRLGAFSYRFWMKEMDKLKRSTGTQHLHRKSKEYRDMVKKKLHAYHVHINIAGIAQGIMQHLALAYPKLVWKSFGGWLRTIRPDVAPSELVVSKALKNTYPKFVISKTKDPAFDKFIEERIDFEQVTGLTMTG